MTDREKLEWIQILYALPKGVPAIENIQKLILSDNYKKLDTDGKVTVSILINAFMVSR